MIQSQPARATNLGPSPAAPPRLRVEHIWLSLPVLLVVWSGFLHQFGLVDFWWHLKTGEILLETGSIPRTDAFSFTVTGTPSVPYCWLAQALYAAAARAGGLPLIVLLNTALLAAALLPVYHLCLERTAPFLRVGVLAALLPAGSLALYGTIRPQVFSFALFAFFSWVLAGYAQRRRDWLWTLPPLMALWVNLHGAFVMGLGLIGLYLTVESLRRVVRGPRSDTLPPRALGKLGVVLFLVAAASLCNPETYRIYEFIRTIQGSDVVRLAVSEWQPPRLNDRQGQLVFFGPFFLILLALLAGRPRLRLTELILFLGSAAFALTASRNGIWFVLLAAPLGAAGLGNLARAVRRRASNPNPAPGATEVSDPVLLNTLFAVVLLAITVLASPWVYPRLGAARLGRHLWQPETPVGAIDYLDQHDLRGRVFHPQVYGDYLIWRLWPRQRSFIDGRTHLFPEEFVKQYLETLRAPQWRDQLASYQIRYLLLSKQEVSQRRMIQEARAAGDCRLLYEDDGSALFEWRPEEN